MTISSGDPRVPGQGRCHEKPPQCGAGQGAGAEDGRARHVQPAWFISWPAPTATNVKQVQEASCEADAEVCRGQRRHGRSRRYEVDPPGPDRHGKTQQHRRKCGARDWSAQ
jgi:hypothetical protein